MSMMCDVAFIFISDMLILEKQTRSGALVVTTARKAIAASCARVVPMAFGPREIDAGSLEVKSSESSGG